MKFVKTFEGTSQREDILPPSQCCCDRILCSCSVAAHLLMSASPVRFQKPALIYITQSFLNNSTATTTFYHPSSLQPVQSRGGGICIQWQLRVLVEINDRQNKTMNLHHRAESLAPACTSSGFPVSCCSVCSAPACALQPSIHHLWWWKMRLIPGWCVLLFAARPHGSEYLNSLCGSHFHLPAGVWSGDIRRDGASYCNETWVPHKNSNAVTFYSTSAADGLCGIKCESVLNSPQSERAWFMKLWKDFFLNVYYVITELWWAAMAQSSLGVSCLSPSSFLPSPITSITVSVSLLLYLFLSLSLRS